MIVNPDRSCAGRHPEQYKLIMQDANGLRNGSTIAYDDSANEPELGRSGSDKSCKTN